MEFKNKVALITGGSSGIGFAVAKKLAEKGSKIAIVGRNEEKGQIALEKLRQIHQDILFISSDVTKSEQVKGIVQKNLHKFGRLDFAFNNAANDEVTFAYSAGKSGVIALSKSAAQEYGRLGIRVNTLSPGAIRTPLLERKFTCVSEEEALKVEERYRGLNALGRIGSSDEAASIVVWLFSNDSSYITGQNIIADGGISFI